MNSFKAISMMFAAAILLTLASCNTTPPIPEGTQVSSVETKSQKIYIRHFGPGGPAFHLIDVALYYEIIDIILEHGGDPSAQNIDKVYDQMGH